MNKRLYLFLVTMTAALFHMTAFARASVPIINHVDIAIASYSGKPLTLESVKKIIQIAGEQSQWQFADGAEKNSLTGTLVVRNKHTISVNIHYSVDKYSITYRDSLNMNFKVDSLGQQLIHPKYNLWVEGLIANIRIQASKF